MTFTPADSWLYQSRKYIEAVEEVTAETVALFALKDGTKPEDPQKIAEQEIRCRVAIEARRELLQRLMAAHSKGGTAHVESK